MTDKEFLMGCEKLTIVPDNTQFEQFTLLFIQRLHTAKDSVISSPHDQESITTSSGDRLKVPIQAKSLA